MALSSGGWVQPPPPASPPSCPRPGTSQAGCHTVLMSVRVSVCHSGIRPLCLPGAADESLRLQLSMNTDRAGEFRLAVRDAGDSGTGRSVCVAEFDLRLVRYEVKSPRCHELCLATPPHDRITFNFRCEKEAQEWATVVMSSLREAQRVADTHVAEDRQLQLEPLEALEPKASASLPQTEELCLELSRAIEAGDTQEASQHAVSLASQQVALKIQPVEKSHGGDGEINLAVVVEDASSSCCVTVKVSPQMAIAALKQQVFLDYGFHPRVQRWVMGQCLCVEARSLASYGVRQDGDTAFLYLLSARQARLTRQLCQQDQESALLTPTPASSAPGSHDWRPYSTLPSRLSHGGASSLVGGLERLGIGEIRDLINLEMPQRSEALGSATQQGWSCPSCTFINKPTRPGCEICSTDRPEGYTVPGGYRPDPSELRRIQQEKEAVRQYQQERGRREDLRVDLPSDSLLYNLNPPLDHDY